jgi:hypothetical protein
MNETDETQLAALMKPTQFNGSYTKDDLNYIPNGNTIYNLNGSSHWVAMCRDGNNFFYFDSFGVVPPQKLEDMIMQGSRDGLYCYNTKEIQAINSSSCGFYCVAFLKWMSRAKQKYRAFQDFKNLFSDKYLKNEEILHELLKQV